MRARVADACDRRFGYDFTAETTCHPIVATAHRIREARGSA
jgi:hypothetical protein